MSEGQRLTEGYCRSQVQKHIQAIADAEREAGIAERGAMVRELSYSDQALRDLYFGVADVALRRRLMWHISEIDEWKLRGAQIEFDDARAASRDARKQRWGYVAGASVFSMVVVYSASSADTFVASACSAALAVWAGRWSVEAERREREAAIRVADDLVQTEMHFVERLKATKPVFSPREIETGERDDAVKRSA